MIDFAPDVAASNCAFRMFLLPTSSFQAIYSSKSTGRWLKLMYFSSFRSGLKMVQHTVKLFAIVTCGPESFKSQNFFLLIFPFTINEGYPTPSKPSTHCSSSCLSVLSSSSSASTQFTLPGCGVCVDSKDYFCILFRNVPLVRP